MRWEPYNLVTGPGLKRKIQKNSVILHENVLKKAWFTFCVRISSICITMQQSAGSWLVRRSALLPAFTFTLMLLLITSCFYSNSSHGDLYTVNASNLPRINLLQWDLVLRWEFCSGFNSGFYIFIAFDVIFFLKWFFQISIFSGFNGQIIVYFRIQCVYSGYSFRIHNTVILKTINFLWFLCSN